MKEKGNRYNVTLNKKQIGFIDKVRKEIKDSSGKKLSKNETIRAMLKACMSMHMKVGSVKTEKELVSKVVNSFRNNM